MSRNKSELWPEREWAATGRADAPVAAPDGAQRRVAYGTGVAVERLPCQSVK
jgi:hypothetical protein